MKRMKNRIVAIMIAWILILGSPSISTNLKASGGTIQSRFGKYESSSTITFYYSALDIGEDSWIGIYRYGTVPGKTPALAYHYVEADHGSTSFEPNEIETFSTSPQQGLPLERGRYKAYLFGDGGYSKCLAECEFYIDGNDPVYSFDVLSDLHVNARNTYKANDKCYIALQDLTRYSPLSKKLIINGDAVDDRNGYFKLQKAFTYVSEGKNQNGYLPDIIFNLGNHELYTTPQRKYTLEFEKKLIDFTTGISKIKLAKNKAYCYKDYSANTTYFEYDAVQCHFIFLAADAYPTNLDDVTHISEEQISWADNTICNIIKNEPDKPIFVFLHETLQNTVTGSSVKYIDNDVKLRQCLNKYPTVTLFTSHTHNDVCNGTWVYPEDESNTDEMTIFNTSSVGWLYRNGESYGNYPDSQGFHVDVYDDSIVVRVRDFANKKWIAEHKIDLNAKRQSLKNSGILQELVKVVSQ